LTSRKAGQDDVGTNPLNDVQERTVQRHNVAAPSKPKEFAMDWNRIEWNWKQFKGKIKEQWGHLTDDDLDKIAGKRE
jgi:CsbD-like